MGYRSSIMMNMQHMGDMIGEMSRADLEGNSRRNSVNMTGGQAAGATVEAELSQELMETQVTDSCEFSVAKSCDGDISRTN
jgi:hypothetical protein